jgi:hypothetical protein
MFSEGSRNQIGREEERVGTEKRKERKEEKK